MYLKRFARSWAPRDWGAHSQVGAFELEGVGFKKTDLDCRLFVRGVSGSKPPIPEIKNFQYGPLVAEFRVTGLGCAWHWP